MKDGPPAVPGAQNFLTGQQPNTHAARTRTGTHVCVTPEAAFDAVSPSSFRLLIYEYGYYPDLELDVAPVEELSGCDFVLEVESAGGTLKDAGAAALNDFVLATSVDL
jgi:hypothetical protein